MIDRFIRNSVQRFAGDIRGFVRLLFKSIELQPSERLPPLVDGTFGPCGAGRGAVPQRGTARPGAGTTFPQEPAPSWGAPAPAPQRTGRGVGAFYGRAVEGGLAARPRPRGRGAERNDGEDENDSRPEIFCGPLGPRLYRKRGEPRPGGRCRRSRWDIAVLQEPSDHYCYTFTRQT